MNDRLIRALTADGRVRVIGVNITQALNEAHRRHQFPLLIERQCPCKDTRLRFARLVNVASQNHYEA